ncbi:MAG: multiheme c-type cytochrome [Polyangiaceae bacterium]
MQRRPANPAKLLGVILGALFLGLGGACQDKPKEQPAPEPKQPSFSLFAFSNLAGALEPCGCQKDMLGGVDHLAALVDDGKKQAPALVVGAGPLFFMNPSLDESRKTQDVWKAEALAQSLEDVGVSAWTPGFNDWAAGQAEFAKLSKSASADLLAANLSGVEGAKATRLVKVGNYQVGIAGVSLPKRDGDLPPGVEAKDLTPALKAAREELKKQGAQLFVGLVSAPRGEVLRLAELAEGFQIMVAGKPFDQGEANDKPIPPTLVGKTLVIQGQNHAQSVARVDVYLRDGSFELQDASGLAAQSERESLQGRIAELEKRIPVWEKSKALPPKELEKKRADLANLKQKLARLSDVKAPAKGSFFRYELVPVKESAGESKSVAALFSSYYRRVNEHNKEAFKDRMPPPVPEGESGYIGVEKCASCHTEEFKFWKTTRHAGAYATLSTQHKEFNLDCVSCHVTGYEKPGGTTVTHVEGLTNVQCEVCHGPGEKHAKDPKKPGLVTRTPLQTLCSGSCHHPPHVSEDWDVNQAWPHIIGPGHGKD